MKFRDPIDWEDSLPIRPSSPAWRAAIRALYGTPLADEELELFRQLAQREPPPGGSDEFLAVVGRRGGKSEMTARIAVFEAVHGGHAVALAPGQLGLVPIISPLREQSGEIVRYCHGLAALPQVRKFVLGEPTRDGLRFKTGIEVRAMTADAVAVSGPTVVVGAREEFAKFPSEGSAGGGDREIDNSLRPALAPLAGAPRRRLIGITSAYIKEGVAYETDRDHFGRGDAPVLVVRGTTEQFNPNIDHAWLERERGRVGSQVFAREYLAEWQDAITEGWFGGDVIDKCIDQGRTEEPEPITETDHYGERKRTYYGAIDSAFRADAYALAIAHREQRADGRIVTVLDWAWSWRAQSGGTLSVEKAVNKTTAILREFGITSPCADQFAFEPLKQLYLQRNIHLRERPWTAQSKPAWFRMVRDQMIDGLARLPNQREVVKEFHAIRGKLLRSGGEQLEARAGHDDLAHAATMAMVEAMDNEPDDGEYERDMCLVVVGSDRGYNPGVRVYDYSRKRDDLSRKPIAEMTPEERRTAFMRDDPRFRQSQGGRW